MAHSVDVDGGRFRYRDDEGGEVVGECEEVRLCGPPLVPVVVTSAVKEALVRPIGSKPLREVASGCRSVAIITSDSTRSVPCAALLDEVVPEVLAAGVAVDSIRVIVAVGAHREATQVEMESYLGKRWRHRLSIASHNAFNPRELTLVGRTASGNDVFINRWVAESDLRIAFGQVEPHEFAGFSGGPKSILAGVSGDVTIRRNHSPVMLSNGRASPGITTGNPIWEEMMEAAQIARLDFIVNVVLTPGLELAGVVAGSVEAAHREAIGLYRELYGAAVPPNNWADVVVTTPGKPLDRNLYQSIKALMAVQHNVRRGGVVVLHAPCVEGVGGEAFEQAFRSANSAGEVLQRLARDPAYRVEMDHAFLLCRMQAQRGIRFVFYTPGVKANVVESMFCRSAASLQDAFDLAMALGGYMGRSRPRVLFYRQPQKVTTE